MFFGISGLVIALTGPLAEPRPTAPQFSWRRRWSRVAPLFWLLSIPAFFPVGQDRDDAQALVFDLMEPRRPVVDGRVLKFVARNKLSAADFVMRDDGVCRLAPQMAARVCQVAAT